MRSTPPHSHVTALAAVWQFPKWSIFRLDAFICTAARGPHAHSREVFVLGLTVLAPCDTKLGSPTQIVAAAVGKPVELSASVCAGLNHRLTGAMKPVLVPSLLDQRVNWLIMREVLATLQASEASLATLKHLSSSKLSRTVQRLTKHEDPTIASVALELVQTWASLALSPWKASAPEVAAAVQCTLAGASGSASDPPTAPSSAEGVASSVLRVALVAAPQLAAACMPPHACPTGLARLALGGWLWAAGSGRLALGGAPHSGGGAAPPRARERQRESDRQTAETSW